MANSRLTDTVQGDGFRLQRAFYGDVIGFQDEALPSVRRCFTSDPWGNRMELPADEAA